MTTSFPRRTHAVLVAAVALAAGACSDDTPTPAEVPDPTAPTIDAASTTVAETTTSSTAPRRAEVDLSVPLQLTRVADLESPTAFAAIPETSRAFVAERSGTVVLLDLSTTPAENVGVALDLVGDVGDIAGEQGLLGLAVDASASQLIVSYTDGGDDGTSVIEAYRLDGDVVDASSRRELLRLEQPFANHNGGHVAFGPEGSLYVGFGDGGSQGDPGDNGQNPDTLLGSILRIEPVDTGGAAAYSVRDDNPFAAGDGGRQEVFLYGVRNPWRFSFDADTGDLWIADVGDSAWEEVDALWASQGGGLGANLGWPLREGRHDTSNSGTASGPLTDPIFEYGHDQGSSITGGYVYRGEAIPKLWGAYLYTDWATPGLRGLVAEDGATDVSTSGELNTGDEQVPQVVSFGQDSERELYVLSLEGGVFRIDAG